MNRTLCVIWLYLVSLMYFCYKSIGSPANLSKFDDNFPTYQCFGSSAMASCVEIGVLCGRPFGGVAILVRNHQQNFCQLVCAFVAVGNLIIVQFT